MVVSNILIIFYFIETLYASQQFNNFTNDPYYYLNIFVNTIYNSLFDYNFM